MTAELDPLPQDAQEVGVSSAFPVLHLESLDNVSLRDMGSRNNLIYLLDHLFVK